MATITKTSNGGSWKFTVTGNDIIATGSTFNFTSPTITATYIYTNYKDYGTAIATLRSLYFGSTKATSSSGEIKYSTESSYHRPPEHYAYWRNSSTKTLSKFDSGLSHNRTYNTATFFNSSNYNKKTLNIRGYDSYLYWYLAESSVGDDMVNGQIQLNEVLATITLDAPPILDSATVTTNTQTYFWKDITTASVALSSSWIQYGGTISSATFTIGDQTVTGTSGTLSIVPNTVGTFTPTLTVTDSRGQTTTKTFSSITVQEYSQPTADWGTVHSSTTGFWANKSNAYINITNFTQSQGFKPTSAQFIIGQQVQIKELTGDETSIPLLINLNTVGTFTPQVKITTSAGVVKTYSYSPITVQEYAPPNIEFTVDRATSSGIISDDETNILVKSIITYKEGCGGLLKPTTIITDRDGNTANAVITWYEAWDENNGVSSPTDWTNYNPSSPKTIYGLVTGYGNTSGFNTNYSFQISITPIDAIESGTTISQIVSSAFYTIDFLAGGHGIAFGQPADKEGFECNMDSIFHEDVEIEGCLYLPTATFRRIDESSADNPANAIVVKANDTYKLAIDWNGTAHLRSIRSIRSGGPCSDGDAYEEILVGNMTYRAQTINSSPSGIPAWIIATIKALCQDYPGKVQGIFKGRVIPNSAAYFEICIYDTSTVNSTGMPQYAYGVYRQWPNTYWDIWIDNYTFKYIVLQSNNIITV